MLSGKRVVVTGAGSGIGRGICEAIVEAGGAVVATDVDQAAAEATAEVLESKGARTISLALDVTDSEALAGVIDSVCGQLGGLDGWVNNAGVLRMASAFEAGEDDWQSQFNVNARAVLDCCSQAAARMIDEGNGGSIVNVASNAGKVGYPNMPIYNASKAAVISLTRSLAAEWAQHRINVNAVCPGGVETPMLEEVARWIGRRESVDPEALLPMMKPAQLGRFVLPIEVGRIVAFLLSDSASVIRGQSINVDGGDTPY